MILKDVEPKMETEFLQEINKKLCGLIAIQGEKKEDKAKILKRLGWSFGDIASVLGKDRGNLYREIKNKNKKGNKSG